MALVSSYTLLFREPFIPRKPRITRGARRHAVDSPEAERRDRLRALKEVRIALESIARNIGWRYKSEFLDLKDRITKIEKEEPLDPDTLDEVWAEAEALAGKAEEIVRDPKFARGS